MEHAFVIAMYAIAVICYAVLSAYHRYRIEKINATWKRDSAEHLRKFSAQIDRLVGSARPQRKQPEELN